MSNYTHSLPLLQGTLESLRYEQIHKYVISCIDSASAREMMTALFLVIEESSTQIYQCVTRLSKIHSGTPKNILYLFLTLKIQVKHILSLAAIVMYVETISNLTTTCSFCTIHCVQSKLS